MPGGGRRSPVAQIVAKSLFFFGVFMRLQCFYFWLRELRRACFAGKHALALSSAQGRVFMSVVMD
jgi:hypothetical protein